MLNIPVEVVEKLDVSPYAACSPRRIWFVKSFLEDYSIYDITFVYLHELGHIIWKHFDRRKDRELRRWRIASDIAINNHLIFKFGYQQPALPGLWRRDWSNLMAEEIDEKLPELGITEYVFDDHIEEELSPEEKRRLIRVIKTAIELHSRMKGDEPGDLNQLLDSHLTDVYLPFELLMTTIANRYISDYTWMQRDRRYVNIYIPDVERESIEIVAAVDTSGSITDEEGKEFLGILYNLYSQYPSLHITLLCCDVRVHNVYEISSEEEIKDIVFQRGGTDFRPVFKWIEENKPDCRFLVYLTDGHGDYPPDSPGYPVLWATTDKLPPWGDYIELRK